MKLFRSQQDHQGFLFYVFWNNLQACPLSLDLAFHANESLILETRIPRTRSHFISHPLYCRGWGSVTPDHSIAYGWSTLPHRWDAHSLSVCIPILCPYLSPVYTRSATHHPTIIITPARVYCPTPFPGAASTRRTASAAALSPSLSRVL